MKRYANASVITYSTEKKYSHHIDWNKQMVYGTVYPGKIFYKKEQVLKRMNSKRLFKNLSMNQISEINKKVSIGNFVRLLDTGDASMARYINDGMYVERISDNGEIFGKLMNANIYIEFLPEMDLLINMSRNNMKINYIQPVKERNREM